MFHFVSVHLGLWKDVIHIPMYHDRVSPLIVPFNFRYPHQQMPKKTIWQSISTAPCAAHAIKIWQQFPYLAKVTNNLRLLITAF